MGETRKIGVEGYPVARLPEDLRRRLSEEGDGKVAVVTVTLEQGVPAQVPSRKRLSERIKVPSPLGLLNLAEFAERARTATL